MHAADDDDDDTDDSDDGGTVDGFGFAEGDAGAMQRAAWRALLHETAHGDGPAPLAPHHHHHRHHRRRRGAYRPEVVDTLVGFVRRDGKGRDDAPSRATALRAVLALIGDGAPLAEWGALVLSPEEGGATQRRGRKRSAAAPPRHGALGRVLLEAAASHRGVAAGGADDEREDRAAKAHARTEVDLALEAAECAMRDRDLSALALRWSGAGVGGGAAAPPPLKLWVAAVLDLALAAPHTAAAWGPPVRVLRLVAHCMGRSAPDTAAELSLKLLLHVENEKTEYPLVGTVVGAMAVAAAVPREAADGRRHAPAVFVLEALLVLGRAAGVAGPQLQRALRVASAGPTLLILLDRALDAGRGGGGGRALYDESEALRALVEGAV